MSAAEDVAQVRMPCIAPLQHDYEVIRPIVLFGESAAARSRQTGIDRTVIGDKARRFVTDGMIGRRDGRSEPRPADGPMYPEGIAGYILYLKQRYPPIHLREIERILLRKFGYKTNHHTLKRFLEPYETPMQLALDLTTFSSFGDAYEARWTVVRMAQEGWDKKRIADCLKLSRAHVYRIVDACEQEGFEGLKDHRTRPPHHPDNQRNLPFLKTFLDLQHAYPRAGRVRLYGLLEQQQEDPLPRERTVGRGMAINRPFHGAPGPWVRAHDAQPAPVSDHHLPYRPPHPHHMWCTDMRYLVKRNGCWVYSMCVMEGYARKMLAGMVSEHQDLTAVLQILSVALAEYGCPEAIVADNGSVCTAGAYLSLLKALEIELLHIEKGTPWQHLIEAQFKVQLRLADCTFERAQTLAAIQNAHAAFIETFHTTRHYAHRKRADGYRTPVDVLGWLRGRRVEAKQLHELLRRSEFLPTVNRHGFVSVQRFSI